MSNSSTAVAWLSAQRSSDVGRSITRSSLITRVVWAMECNCRDTAMRCHKSVTRVVICNGTVAVAAVVVVVDGVRTKSPQSTYCQCDRLARNSWQWALRRGSASVAVNISRSSRAVTSQLGQLSLASLRGRLIEYQLRLRNALFDALHQLSGTRCRKLFSVVTLLQFLSLG